MKKFIILMAMLLSFMPVYAADCGGADTMICPQYQKLTALYQRLSAE